MVKASENMAAYMRNRRRQRREKAVKLLGGHCVNCKVEDKGQCNFDHIDPTTKSGTLASMWDLNWNVILEELAKCQLLCVKCHHEKTLVDFDLKNARLTHGTVSSYKYCRCQLCREAKAAWTRDYRKRVGRKS